MIELCMLGTGAMMPLPERRLASAVLRLNGRILLIDCGEGTQVAVREAGYSLARIDAIFLTHFHADHVAGLPGLLLSAGTDGRVTPITLYGPAGIEAVVHHLRVIAPELPYSLQFVELNNVREATFESAKLTFFKLNHMIPCYGVAVELRRRGKFNLDRAKTMGIPMAYWSVLQRGESVGSFTPDMVLGPDRKGIKIAYMTDTRPPQKIAPIKDADLLICEGTYGETEKADKADLHGHMTFAQAAELALRANASELLLTHFSPSIKDPDEYIENARTLFKAASAAKDLMKRTLTFAEE